MKKNNGKWDEILEKYKGRWVALTKDNKVISSGYNAKSVYNKAREKGIDIYESLRRHNFSYVLREVGDVVITGATGANVMDLNVIVVL